MNRSRWFLIVFLALLGIGGWSWFHKRSIPLQQNGTDIAWVGALSAEDRFFLESFLRYLVIHDSFGYVLFGEKPLGFGGLYKPNIGNWSAISSGRVILQKGYDVFRAHQNFHEVNKDFALIVDEDECSVFIYMINKKSFIDVVEKNIAEFRKILGNGITGKVLLDEIVLHKQPVMQILNQHEGLFGTLLGFGKNNAFLYHRKMELENKIAFPFPYPVAPAVEKELREVNSRLASFNNRSILQIAPMPNFCAELATAETQELKKSYRRQCKKISAIYKSAPFLETTLQQLYDGYASK